MYDCANGCMDQIEFLLTFPSGADVQISERFLCLGWSEGDYIEWSSGQGGLGGPGAPGG